MYYKLLGKLDKKHIDFFKSKILIKEEGFSRFEFDDELTSYFDSIFLNKDLKVQYNPVIKKLVQKAFVSKNTIYPIHKDGERCTSALNIAVMCNSTDWVRWYSDDVIEKLSSAPLLDINGKKTRNTDISDIEGVPYLCEFVPEEGDVYTIDVDTYHTWKSSGEKYRIIIQTKFDGFIKFDKLTEILSQSSFRDMY